MAKWPEKRRLIGTKVQRIDGPGKSTGTAKYGYDINRKGMLHAVMLRSPHAHAKIKSIDTTPAEKMKGVKAVFAVRKAGDEVYYAGDEILAIAADTEEHALDAVRAVKIDFEVLDHLVTEEDALKSDGKKTLVTQPNDKGNLVPGGERTAGNVDDALKTADAVVEETYGVPVQTHVCLESHGLVAEWDSDGGLTVWASTQAVDGTAQGLAQYFQIPPAKVKCITHNMGGGYGSKFGADIQGNVAAQLAKQAGAAVKLFLDRADEHTAGGNRPSAYAKVKIAGTKDGKVTAFAAEIHGTPGVGRSAGVNMTVLPYVYAVPNVKLTNTIVRLNAGGARAMRAPGHPQNCFITEAAIDDLCNKLGLNPMDVRLKNLPADNFPDGTSKAKLYTTEIEIARRLSEWDKKWHKPGEGGKGPIKHGIGVGLHTWGGAGRAPNDTRVTISGDGSVSVQSSTQDLGTGQRTVLPIVVAEGLGLEVKDITVQIGESPFGRSTGSGGSTTCPATAPSAWNATEAARTELFKKIAPKLGVQPDDLSIEPGKVVAKGGKSWTWKEACARLGMDKVEGTGNWMPGLSSVGVGGVQVAEVLVDTETGVVRCTRVVAVQDCGLIINLLGCESQTTGGVIMGVNYALFEDRIMDRHTGRQVNPDMEFYKLGGIEDMPEIVVHMHDMPERGVIGIGEPPTIATAAAIGNAVCNAIGVRVPSSPFSPNKVLAALAKKGGA
jgi:xanthine dehydrogenase YagR molybdenum-binding subunit